MFSAKRETSQVAHEGRTLAATPLQARSSERKVLLLESSDGDYIALKSESKGMPEDSDAGLLRGRKSKRGGRKLLGGLPPSINTTPVFAQTLRFTPSVATPKTITSADLRFASGTVATDSTHVRPFCSAVKLRSITVWPSCSTTAPPTVDIQWFAQSEYDKDDVMDGSIPQGATMTRGSRFAPPPWSLSANWLNAAAGGANDVFVIEAPVGSIVDVELDCVLANSQSADGAGPITGPATVGLTYWCTLDYNTGKTYQVVGRPAAPQ